MRAAGSSDTPYIWSYNPSNPDETITPDHSDIHQLGHSERTSAQPNLFGKGFDTYSPMRNYGGDYYGGREPFGYTHPPPQQTQKQWHDFAGVRLKDGRWIAELNNNKIPGTHKRWLGTFNSRDEAGRAVAQAKRARGIKLNEKKSELK